MMIGWRAEKRGNQLYVGGLSEPNFDIIAFEMYKGDVLVLTRTRGYTGWAGLGQTQYYPTCFEVCRIMPISSEYQRMGGKSMRDFTRLKRKEFEGHYRVEERICDFYPGRKRSFVKLAIKMMKDYSQGKTVDWSVLPAEKP